MIRVGRTPSLFAVLICLAFTTVARAQEGESSFNTANRYFAEQSSSRACDAFGEFLKSFPSSALAAEAKVKRARACLAVGKDYNKAIADLRAAADDNSDAFAQALANAVLAERGEYYTKKDSRGRGALALDQMQVAARQGGRTGKEARAYFFSSAQIQLQQAQYDLKRTEALTEQILRMEPSVNDRARALLSRAQTYLNQGGELHKKAEKELADIGKGNSEVADDALYLLGEQRSQQGDYVGALGIYDDITRRWNGTNSNVHTQAARQAEYIRRPTLSTSLSYFELPGQKPELRIDFRNLKRAQVTLKLLDPMKLDASRVIDTDPTNLGGDARKVREWSVDLKEPSRHAPGTFTQTVDAAEQGVYIVEVRGDDLTASAWTLITPNAVALKIARERVAAFVSDTVTGQAVKSAKVYFAVQFYDQKTGEETERRFDAQTDEHGVAVVELKDQRPLRNVVVWAQSDAAYAYARGYSNSYYQDRKDFLAYVMTDRPLYKPGEKVGVKAFLRTRADGPSTPVSGGDLTVRVYDPQSRELKLVNLKTNEFGTASFDVQLPKDATLGLYRFALQSNHQSYQQTQATFRVEEYKPPEFTVSVQPVGAPEPGKPIKMRITASRYSGGPVANANGRAIVSETGYQHVWAPWEDDVQVGWWSWYGGYGYNDYGDDDGYSYKRGRYGGYYPRPIRQHTLVFKTGADGSAEVEIPAPTEPGDRTFKAQVFVTDATRREVTGSGTINVSSTPYFVDLRSDRYLYKPGETIKVKLRSEDANGRATNPAVEVVLLRIDKSGTTSEILRRKATLANGRGEVSLDGDAVGPVRIQVRAPGGNEASPLASTDVWLTSDTKPIAPPNAGFNVYTDRAPLLAGGTLRALIVTQRAGGHAFLTVEGQTLFYAKGIAMNGQARFIEIPLTGQMTPNAWLNVSRFEDTQVQSRQSVIKVSGSDSAIDVQVAHTAELIEPGMKQSTNVTLKNFSGETELMVTSVDEALFAIEPMRKDFLSWFGRRPQQLWVTTAFTQGTRAFRPRKVDPEKQLQQPQPLALNDAYPADESSVEKKAMAPASMGASKDMDDEAPSKRMAKEESAPRESAKMKGAGLKPGGEGGAGADEPVKVRTNFSSSAGWFAAVRAQGRASVSLEVPDSLSRFKTVVLAVSKGPNMGVGEAGFRTEKPLMVRLQAPRFFTERDEVTLSALVSNRTSRPVTTEVSFAVGNHLKALDRTKKTVDVPANGDVRVDVRYVVVEPGEVSLQVIAKGGGKSDAMAVNLNVVTHGAAQRVAFNGRLGDTVSMKLKLPEQRNANATRYELTLSPTLVSVMMDALPYLAQYPYGCVEQTLSRFVPAVIARRAAKDLGMPKARVPADLDDMVTAGLARLYNFQHGDGGWGWWHADTTNRGMTAYVVYGLSLARDAGVSVKSDAIERGRRWLIDNAGAADAEEQAFMVMALAHSGQVPKDVMDKAFNRRTKMSKRAKAMLALAMVKASDKRARIAVENLDDILNAAKERTGELSAGDANDPWSTSEAIETTAYALMAVSRFDMNNPNVKPLTDFLVLRRNGGKWRTTRDTAFSVYALSDLARIERAASASGGFIVEVNGREVKRVKYGNGGMDLQPIVLTDEVFKPGDNVVSIKRDGGGTGYYGAMFDVYNRDENVKGVGGDIKVTRRFTLLGKVAAVKEQLSTAAEYGMPVESGLRVRVDLEIKANKAMEYVMVEDLKPAGFEAVAQKSGPELCSYQCAHVELRTDRVAFFITNLNVGVTKYSYELRAEVPGKFHALPARAEAMYAPELRATSDEMRFDVRDAPEPLDVGVTENNP